MVKCSADLCDGMPAGLKKGASTLLQARYSEVSHWHRPLHGCDSQLLACNYTFLLLCCSSFSSTKNGLLRIVALIRRMAKWPLLFTHTVRISPYSCHTSCLWLIKTCFIHKTRQGGVLLISHWRNNKAAGASTRTPPHEIKQFTLGSKDFCCDRNRRDLIMRIMPSFIQWKVKMTREITSAYMWSQQRAFKVKQQSLLF